MTERFVVPAPSADALQAFIEAKAVDAKFHWRPLIGAAYAVDLPAIVRAEVTAALLYLVRQLDFPGQSLDQVKHTGADYLTARYGAAPDNERSPSPDNDSREALRAPTFTREAEACVFYAAKYQVAHENDDLKAMLEAKEGYVKASRAYLASREGR